MAAIRVPQAAVADVARMTRVIRQSVARTSEKEVLGWSELMGSLDSGNPALPWEMSRAVRPAVNRVCTALNRYG